MFAILLFINLNFSSFQALNSQAAVMEHSLKTEDEATYDYRFFWQNSDRTDVQELFVSWTDDDSEIQFTLALYSKKCETKITGTAKTILNQDPEMDEDDEGNAYAATQFVFEDKEGTLYIRIAEDKEKCKIHYESRKRNLQFCEPLSDLLMYSE